jgi:hypothetical protein
MELLPFRVTPVCPGDGRSNGARLCVPRAPDVGPLTTSRREGHIDLADPDGARLEVRETVVHGYAETPKSERSERTIALGPKLAAELFDHRRRSKFQGDDERVFCHPLTGGVLRRDAQAGACEGPRWIEPCGRSTMGSFLDHKRRRGRNAAGRAHGTGRRVRRGWAKPPAPSSTAVAPRDATGRWTRPSSTRSQMAELPTGTVTLVFTDINPSAGRRRCTSPRRWSRGR